MRVINQCDNSICINDIDLIIPFSSTGESFEIDSELVERSTILHVCLAKGMIVDASKEKGVPGAYTRHQAMLVSEDQYRHPDRVPKPKNGSKQDKESFPSDKTYAIWHGPAFDFGGYANMNRRFMFGLDKMGDQIKYKELPSMKDAGPEIAQRLSRLTRTKVPDWAPMVYGMTAPLCYHWEKYKVLFTMMETRALHPHYVERCNSADEIIVPSHWCKKVFRESGVTKPLRVIPLGVDTSLYVPGVKPMGFSKGLKDFVFLSVFGWSMRKGYDVLLKAYFEEFTSDDPVSLLIMSRYKGSTDEHQKNVIREDIARTASMVRNPKKPHVLLFGDTLSDEMMPRLYASADCYVLISRGEGFGLPYCFPAGESVFTPCGIVDVENVRKGDEVWSHSGNVREVKATMKRPYKGDLVVIRALMNNKRLRITPDDLMLCVKKSFKKSNDQRHASLTPEWVKAKDIEKGDLLVVPVPKRSKAKRCVIDLSLLIDIPGLEFDDKHIWSKYSNRPNLLTAQDLSEYSGVSLRQVRRVMSAKDKKSKIPRISEEKRIKVNAAMDALGYDDKSKVKINRFVLMDEDLAYIIGLYAAEGSLSGPNLAFDFHQDEKDLHEETRRIILSKFDVNPSFERGFKDSKAYEIGYSCAPLMDFFDKMCNHGALSKDPSEYITEADDGILDYFLRGLQDGDGISVAARSIDERICTSSKVMAMRVWVMLLQLGKSPSFIELFYRKDMRNTEYVVRYTNMTEIIEDRKRSPYTKTINCDGYVLSQVIDIFTEAFEGDVFNFEVEEDNSYCVNGFAVHNCEAAACGLPVIGSRYSGQTDFLDDDNSYLVDIDGFRKADRDIAWISYFYEDAEFPTLGAGAVEQTRVHMRDVFENRDKAQEKAERLRGHIVKNFDWSVGIQKMHDRLRELNDERRPK